MENIDGKLILDFSNLSNNNDYLVSIDDKLINVDLKEKYVFPSSQISAHNITIIKRPLRTTTQIIIETLDALFNSYITEFDRIIENATIYHLKFQVICNSNPFELVFKDFENKIEIVSSSATVIEAEEHTEYNLKDIKIMCSLYLVLFYIPLALFSLFLSVQSFSILIHQSALKGIGLLSISCIILLLLYFFERKTAVLTKSINILRKSGEKSGDGSMIDNKK